MNPNENPNENPGENPGETPNENPNENPNPEVKKPDPVFTEAEKPLNIYTAFDAYESDNGMPYRIYCPANYSEEYAYPVILFLHGAGERGTDNEAPLIHVLQGLFDNTKSPAYQSIIIVPQCPKEEQWVNTPWADLSYDSDAIGESDALAEAMTILETVCEDYSVNSDRIYAMGLSMGGYGTWDLLMRHSDVFAAGVPMCGAADLSKADILKDMPIYAFHGTVDGVVNVKGTDDIYNAIIEAGGDKIIYKRVEGRGHDVWVDAGKSNEMVSWLFEQRK